MAHPSRTLRIVTACALLAATLVTASPTSAAATCTAGVGLFFNDSATGDTCECHFSGWTIVDWIVGEILLGRQAGSPYECSATHYPA